jgi:8-oxo-dGTP pyrophosphatase MutT (NUDIX family)
LSSTSSEETGFLSSTTEIIPKQERRFLRAVVHEGEDLIEAVLREVHEETGVGLDAEPTLLGTHEHLDAIGHPAASHFFRVDAPDGIPRAWQHVVTGNGEDAGLLFDCRFDPAPLLWPVQSEFRAVEGHS